MSNTQTNPKHTPTPCEVNFKRWYLKDKTLDDLSLTYLTAGEWGVAAKGIGVIANVSWMQSELERYRNTHEALVSALLDATKALETDWTGQARNIAIANARAALKLAEGTTMTKRMSDGALEHQNETRNDEILDGPAWELRTFDGQVFERFEGYAAHEPVQFHRTHSELWLYLILADGSEHLCSGPIKCEKCESKRRMMATDPEMYRFELRDEAWRCSYHKVCVCGGNPHIECAADHAAR